jgi:uncharacterized phage protein gp47/JayE
MADYQYINNTGTIIPDSSQVLTQVQNEFKEAFGQNLIVTPDTPQGVLIVAEALARIAVLSNNAALANQINPNIAGGVLLKAICALMGLQANPATFTEVIVQVTGVAGTVISTAATAALPDNTLFQNTEVITLDVNGNGEGTFRCTISGPIEVPINSLNRIVNGVLGWETVSNSAIQFFLGSEEQSDAALRLLRRQTLGLQGQGLAAAIEAALALVPGVTSFSFRENFTGSSIVIETVTLVAHSMYACVQGGTDLDVGTAILSKKDCGCNFNGGTTVNVTDPVSGQIYPVKFDRPTQVNILIRATIQNTSIITNIESVVKNAILAYVNGDLTDEPGFTVGEDVSCFELAGAINIASPQLFVLNLETTLASDPGGWSNATIPINIDEIAATNAVSITVNIS